MRLLQAIPFLWLLCLFVAKFLGLDYLPWPVKSQLVPRFPILVTATARVVPGVRAWRASRCDREVFASRFAGKVTRGDGDLVGLAGEALEWGRGSFRSKPQDLEL